MRSLNSFALLGLAATTFSCSDTQESVSGVFPSSGFIGRTVRVEVSGDNVSWVGGSVTLDFGPDITVGTVTVASPTSLFAEITISPTAALGPRDIFVRSDGDSLALRNSFELGSPIVVDFQGSLAQGSVVNFTVHNFDFLQPFDDTCAAASLFGCMAYDNVVASTPAGTQIAFSTVSPYTLSGTMYVDIDAESGPIMFTSGPADDADKQVISAIGVDTAIAARTAVALTDAPTTTTVAEGFESHLYEFTAPATSVTRLSLSPGNDAARPNLYILPASGRFSEMVTAGAKPNVVSEPGGKYYAVYADMTGLDGYSYIVRANPTILASTVAEVDNGGSNDLATTAQLAASSTILFKGATISSATDSDWIKFNVGTGDGAKKVRVVTAGSDPMTDTYVEIWKNNDTLPANKIGTAADQGYHEDVTSAVIGNNVGVILVKISGSEGYFQDEHNAYIAAIWLE